MLVAVATFALAAVLIILLPGPDTLVVLRSVLRGGRAGGLRCAAGVVTGLVVWIAVASLGLAAVLRASHVAYDVLRVVGGCYLVWLGITTLRAIRRTGAPPTERRGLVGTGYPAGLVTNLLNPKVGVFFVTFLPGFVPDGSPVAATSLLFGAVFLALTVLYFALLLTLAQALTAWLARPRVSRWTGAVTGTVLVGFGIRLAVES